MPWTNKKVRQALNLAVNRAEILRTIFAGEGTLAYVSGWLPISEGWNPEWEKRFEQQYGYNPAKAKLYDYIHRGQSPEAIAVCYPSLILEQVYATITYYLHNRDTIHAYLENWLEHGRRMRAAQEQSPPPVVVRLRTLATQRHHAEARTP